MKKQNTLWTTSVIVCALLLAMLSVSLFTGCAKEEAFTPLSDLSAEQITEMKKAGAVISEVYGTCDGYILFASTGQMGEPAFNTVADSFFAHPVEAYKDGTIIRLQEAYEKEIFSKEQIATIADAQKERHPELHELYKLNEELKDLLNAGTP